MEEKQKEAEKDWCKMVGLKPTEFNMMIAPVLKIEWEKVKPQKK